MGEIDSTAPTPGVPWGAPLLVAAPLAAAVAYGLPGGFPLSHPRFWTNRALPLVVLAACAAVLFSGARRTAPGRALSAALAGLLLGAGLAAPLWFPVSGPALCLPMLLAGGAAALAAAWRTPSLRWLCLALSAGLLPGLFLPYTQRAPAPSTRPLHEAPPAWPAAAPASSTGLVLGQLFVGHGAGEVRLDAPGRPSLVVTPTLRFRDRSPDGGWTVWSVNHRPTPWTLHAAGQDNSSHSALLAWTGSTGRRWLQVQREGTSTLLEAWAELPEPIYAHLASASVLSLQTTLPVDLAFSPCPNTRVEVKPADYPTGRPARMACLGGDEVFRVFEATSGEKGPFHEIASGPLRRGEALAVSILVGGEPVWRVTWDDWAAQASTELSPTAGWGFPQNALEFRRTDEGLVLFLTLAATSVGRGWDSVGHAAGVYRNRIRVEPR